MEQARKQMDQLENYVIARGIQGYRWFEDSFWEYRRFKSIDDYSVPRTTAEIEHEQFLKEQRAIVLAPLSNFQEKLKQAKIGRDYVCFFEKDEVARLMHYKDISSVNKLIKSAKEKVKKYLDKGEKKND